MPEPRIVIVNDASVARGGATGLALLQARLLRARGFEVTYVAGDRGGNPDLPGLGIEVITAGAEALMAAPPLTAATRGLYNRAARDLLARLIETRDTPETVYHVHGFSKVLSPSIFAALRRVAPRVFLHAHDFFLACPNGAFMDYQAMQPCERVPLSAGCLATGCDKRNHAQKLWRVARQAVLHRTLPRDAPWGGIVMIHPAMGRYLEKAGYPPALLHSLRNPATAFRAERVRAEENREILFIGRVEAEKGIEELLAAAAAARVPLRVIGDGPLRESLAARHPEVGFAGWMERPQIAREIAGARALVMPSRYPEPFGLVAAEAALSGLPVLLSRTAFLGPEMERAGLGMTCDTRDPGAFAAALRRIAELPAEEIAGMSRRGAAGAAGLCTGPDDWIEAQIRLWRGAIAGAPAGAPAPGLETAAR